MVVGRVRLNFHQENGIYEGEHALPFFNLMKLLKNFLNKKNIHKVANLDDKTVFFLFKKIVKEELGNVGLEKLQPDYFAKGMLYVKSMSASWSSELWLQKDKIMRKINQEIGKEEIKDIKLK